MNQYIITEEELSNIIFGEIKGRCADGLRQFTVDKIRSRPYNPREGMVWMTSEEEETRIRQAERDKVLTEKRIDYLRSLGWMVAVHNDYKQNGEFHTFWLLTYPDGEYLKGEGKTDEEAFEQIVEELRQAGEP